PTPASHMERAMPRPMRRPRIGSRWIVKASRAGSRARPSARTLQIQLIDHSSARRAFVPQPARIHGLGSVWENVTNRHNLAGQPEGYFSEDCRHGWDCGTVSLSGLFVPAPA